ncbi:polyphosphate polymerase domain-containing protein [Streptococcus cameli]
MKTRMIQKQFKRMESKYILDKSTFLQMKKELEQYMQSDEFAASTITNIYFDNQNFDIIQDSIAKKNGREKVRMRIYDARPSATSQAFLEIKKKIDKVGYKYRLTSNPKSVLNYIEKGMVDATIKDEQVTFELQELRSRYGTLKPMMYIYYDRLSFKGKEDKKVRLTIDQHLLYRAENVSVQEHQYGNTLLSPDKVIMEIKVPDQQPKWLVALLEKYQIEKKSFSKYGNAYRLHQESLGGETLANRII